MSRSRFWTATVVAFAVFLLTPLATALVFYDIVLFFRGGLEATISQTLTDYAEGVGIAGPELLWTGIACLWTCAITILAVHFLGWWMLPTRTRRLMEQARREAREKGLVSIEHKLSAALKVHARS